jgi:hypothetical protein
MSKKYRLYFELSVPVKDGGWRRSKSVKTLSAYSALDAANKLRSHLVRKWSNGILVAVYDGQVCKGEWTSINPDIIPELNAPIAP